MRPVELTLCGWGPYKDKQPPIDFTKLKSRGLFLITGATGAGKTTVFDAITYALYGDMSGRTREKNSVRSDFADAATPTYVELLMEHEGKRYHIRRNPEYLRPKKKKSGSDGMTREKENAVLTMPDGSHIEGSSEVTRKIQEILRINIDQFKQLSMIPQGEFTRLLTAQASEKSKIFREIFNTELYDRIAGELKHRSSGLYKQVMECKNRMEEDIELFVPPKELSEKWKELTESGCYYYQGILDFLKENKREYGIREKELEQEQKEAEEKAEGFAVLVKEGEETQSFLLSLEAEKERKQKLKEQEPVIAEKEERLQKAVKAAGVKEYESRWQTCQKQQEELADKLAGVKKEIEKLKAQKEKGTAFYQNIEELLPAYERQEKEEELRKELLQAEKRSAKQQEELRRLKERYLQVEAEEEKLKTDYENADKSYRHGIAGILAEDLTEGTPCPVCGSLKHPNKAVTEEGAPTEEEVERKRQLYEAKREELTAVHGETAACRERGDSLAEEAEELKEKLAMTDRENKNRAAFIKEYLKLHTKQVFLKEKKDHEALLVRLKEREKNRDGLKTEYTQKLADTKHFLDVFEDQRKLCGFEQEEEYRQAFLTETEMEDLREAVQKYKQDCHACSHLIAHLQEKLSGRKQTDVEELKEKLKKAKEEKEEIYQRLTLLKQGVRDMTRLYDSLKEKEERSEKLSKEYGMWKDLDDAANGNNSKRLVFEQYVLASYFEEILKAANLRLHGMTGGRYELRRLLTVGDGRSKDSLEMEVLDYYTGKYRSVKTLSGGETFKVSLSLALGMSDVVQAVSGGIYVDTLFIDEGFGSLDSESLEQACETLHSLVEKDRLIGIISHVPELSEKIENQIRIKKTSAGSRIEVMV